MTLSSATSFVNHSPDGVETTFAYNFRVDEAAHMKVYADGVLYSAAKTVTGLTNPAGGTVIFTTAPAATITRLTLQREVTLDQQSAYPFQSPFPSSSHERALDKLTMITQQLSDEIGRAVVAPPGETSQFVLPAYEAGKFWRWNPLSQVIEVVDLAAGIIPIGNSIGDMITWQNVGGSPGIYGGLTQDMIAALANDDEDWVNYFSSSTIQGITSPSGVILIKTIGKILYCMFDISGTGSTTAFSFTLPVNCNATLGASASLASATNAGAALETGYLFINANTSTVNLRRSVTTITWTASGDRAAQGQFFMLLAN